MKKRYKGLHLIFWDMTSIDMPKLGDAQMQQLTYSSYFANNVFKGAIGLQQCGWIVTHNLWTRCMSDTAYQEKSGIFEMQQKFSEQKFSEQDLVNEILIPFLNIFDKGYQNRLAAWRAGNQLTAQPVFAKSNQKFRRKDTLSSAAIASDRSSNERAVRITKLSSYLHNGLSNNQCMRRIHFAWLCWAFQSNFMFAPVL